MTDQAVQILHSQPKDSPWLLTVSWNPPHPLLIYPQRTRNITLKRACSFAPTFSSSDAPRQAAQGYYGGITGVDLEFARLLDTLDKTGLTENTIVIYTSDHGEMMGSHGRMAKQVPFEESCRVPFFIRYPGITPPGQSSQALFSAMDIYPTLCGLAGIALPAGRGGRDLSDILRGRRAASPADVVFLMNQVGRRAHRRRRPAAGRRGRCSRRAAAGEPTHLPRGPSCDPHLRRHGRRSLVSL